VLCFAHDAKINYLDVKVVVIHECTYSGRWGGGGGQIVFRENNYVIMKQNVICILIYAESINT
jgi:hypothetical protein